VDHCVHARRRAPDCANHAEREEPAVLVLGNLDNLILFLCGLRACQAVARSIAIERRLGLCVPVRLSWAPRRTPVPTVGVHEGASLAGNDSVPACWTRSSSRNHGSTTR